jgi:D-glycero-D-manno-heptose 1,7-bisphosphate phosphatase
MSDARTRAAFLDRDGTIIKDYPDIEWTGRQDPEWLPGAVDAVRDIASLGYRIVVITNQYLIGEGFITEADYRSLTTKLLATLADAGVLDVSVYHCPHPRWEPCGCSKPKRGLIDQAMGDHPRIELTRSTLVGDSASDMALGQHLGVRTFGINTGGPPVWGTRVQSLQEVASILRKDNTCVE